jgi:hypothetical protein
LLSNETGNHSNGDGTISADYQRDLPGRHDFLDTIGKPTYDSLDILDALGMVADGSTRQRTKGKS